MPEFFLFCGDSLIAFIAEKKEKGNPDNEERRRGEIFPPAIKKEGKVVQKKVDD